MVDGKFNALDSKQMLLNLIADKVNHHHRKNFSSVERFGHSDPHSDQRLTQLNEVAAKLVEFLDGLNDSVEVAITAKVELSVHDKA